MTGALAGGRRRDDEDRHQPERRRADRRAELDRRLGRAVRGAGRPHAGVRRRRQPQEPAVGLRSLRRPEPGAHRHRRRRSHRGRRRHRLLRGLLRERGSLGQRARRRRRDELARRGHRHDRSRAAATRSKGSSTSATSRAASSAATATTDISARGYRCPPMPRAPQCATRTCCSGRGTPISAARSSATRSGSTAPTTTSRSTRSSPASPRTSPPTSASSTTTPPRARGKASTKQHAHRLLPARPQAEAAARAVDLAPARIDPGAGQLVEDVQGRVAVGVQQPRLPERQRRQLHARLADGAGGRSGGEAAAGRSGSTDRGRGRRLEQLHDRPQQAAGEGAADLLLPRRRRQPRPQVRLRGHLRLVPLRHQRLQRPVPLLVSAFASGQADRIRFADTGVASGLRARTGRSAPNIDQHHSVLRAGSLVAEQPAVDHGGPAHRLSEDLLPGRVRKPEITDSPPYGSRSSRRDRR